MLDEIKKSVCPRIFRIAEKKAFLALHGTHRVVYSKEANIYAIQYLKENGEWSEPFCEKHTEEAALNTAIRFTQDDLKEKAIGTKTWEEV